MRSVVRYPVNDGNGKLVGVFLGITRNNAAAFKLGAAAPCCFTTINGEVELLHRNIGQSVVQLKTRWKAAGRRPQPTPFGKRGEEISFAEREKRREEVNDHLNKVREKAEGETRCCTVQT